MDTEIAQLIACLKHEKEHIREEAAWALSKLGPQAIAAALPLVEVMADRSLGYGGAKEAAGVALAAMGATSEIPKLIQLLEDDSVEVCG